MRASFTPPATRSVLDVPVSRSSSLQGQPAGSVVTEAVATLTKHVRYQRGRATIGA